MAIGKGKESTLELCTRATQYGNSVSVRMLEYLSTAKNHPHGFRELATDFLEVSRLLCAIEAGLAEASQKGKQFPPEMLKELSTKFRHTYDDFVVLNQMLLKFLDYERKGTLGKFQKSWHMMFSGTDVEKMRASLAKSLEALRMSSMVFRWSVGDAKADASIGIAYTGLSAALERMNKARPTVVIPMPQQEQAQRAESVPQLLPPAHFTPPASPGSSQLLGPGTGSHRGGYGGMPQIPPVPSFEKLDTLGRADSRKSIGSGHLTYRNATERSYASPAASPIASPATTSPTLGTGFMSDQHSSYGTYSTLSSAQQNHMSTAQTSYEAFAGDDFPLRHTGDSKSTVTEEAMGRPSFNYPTTFTRIKADRATVQRWTPRGTGEGISPNARAALRAAIQQKDYRTVERILDSGLGVAAPLEPGLLTLACLNLDTQSIRLLLLFGADPDSRDRDCSTPLMCSISMGFMEGAKMLLKYGADPSLCAGRESESSLALAVRENKFEFVHLCLMYGADACAIMENGSNALVSAVRQKGVQSQLVEIMLDYDADVNAKDREGRTALFEGIQARRPDLVELLLDHGAEPNLPGPKHPLWPSTYQPQILRMLLARGGDPRKTPGVMELAASIKNIESIQILLDHGVSPDIRKDGIYTPLCSAIRDNSIDVVDLLLARGADPNLMASEYPAFKCVTHRRIHILPKLVAAGSDLHNPKGIIETAVAHNYWEALEYLLRQGVNPNDKNADGHTPLTTAIREDRGDFVELLLAKGADPGIRGQDWPICMAVKRPAILEKLLARVQNPSAVRGVMEMAVQADQLESIKLLLAAGVSVEDKNGGVFSPLTTAIREQKPQLVRFLLEEAGANPNAPGEHLPIIKAIRRLRPNDYEIIEMLIAKGASINKMYRGWNAILQAVENGDADLLRLLIAKGGPVDLTVTDEEGKLVIDTIAERGWEEGLAIIKGSA